MTVLCKQESTLIVFISSISPFIYTRAAVNIILYLSMSKSEQQPFIDKLFSKPKRTLDELISFLDTEGMVQFLGPGAFCSRVTSRLGQQDGKKFAERFLEEIDKNEQLKETLLLPYPVHSKDQEDFEKIKVGQFASAYLLQRKQQQQGYVANGKATTKKTYANTSQDIFYFDFSDPQQLGNTIEKTAKKKTVSKKAKKKTTSKKAKQANCITASTPQEFLGKYERAMYQLLQLNISSHFSSEVEEVKEVIIDQTKNSAYVIDIYANYLTDYLFVNYMKCLQCNERIPEDQLLIKKLEQYFSNYLHEPNRKIRYLPTIKDSCLKETWNIIYSNAKDFVEKNTNNLKERTANILSKGIQTIFLTYQLNQLIYANLNNKTIFINLNHLGVLTLKQFKQGPLKSYLTLCILHLEAHYLVRNFQHCKFGQNDSSYEAKSEQIGNLILKLMQSYTLKRPEEHAIKDTILAYTQQAKEQEINELAKCIYQSMEKHKALFDSLKRYSKEWKKISTELYLIANITQRTMKIPIKMSKWQQIYGYIEALSKSKKRSTLNHQKIKEKEYNFFFTIFCMDNVVVEWLKRLGQDKSLYMQYKDKLEKMDIRCFYIRQNPVVEEIIGIIRTGKIFIDKLEEDPEVKMIINTFEKDNKLPFLRLNKNINDFLEKIDKQNIRNFKEDIYSIETLVYKIFPHFKYDKFAEISSTMEKYPKPIQSNPDLAVFLFVKDFHKKIMSLAKELEVISISVQLPSMYNSDEADKQRLFESGFIVEKQLFPLLSKNIYAKDYEFLQKISQNFMEIGKQPQAEEAKRSKIDITRRGLPKNDLSIDISSAKRCGLNQKRILWQRIKRLAEKESEEQEEEEQLQEEEEEEQEQEEQESEEKEEEKSKEEWKSEEEWVSEEEKEEM